MSEHVHPEGFSAMSNCTWLAFDDISARASEKSVEFEAFLSLQYKGTERFRAKS